MLKRNPVCGCGDGLICNETELTCDPCCRCIPLRLCATFEAYGCGCDGSAVLLELDQNLEYVGSVACGLESADLLVHIYEENNQCFWRVISESQYIDELFEISPYAQSCETPDLEINVGFDECSGVIRIQAHHLKILPPRVVDECIEEPWCGMCRCVCRTLCVTRRIGGVITNEELEWDPDSRCWGDICLIRDEYTGDCLVSAPGFDPVPITDCELGISFSMESGYDAIVGHCRVCACQSCTGCCFPFGFNSSGTLFLKDLEWELSAPSCPDLDGLKGTFVPVDPTGPIEGSCGFCAVYQNLDAPAISGRFPGMPLPDPYECGYSSCSQRLCFELCCELENESSGTSGECCTRLRLLISSGYQLSGDRYRTLSCQGVDHIDPCTAGPMIEIRPMSCVCDSVTGLSAIFGLSSIQFVCDRTVATGPCAGEPDCCMPVNCSLEGATLSISVKS